MAREVIDFPSFFPLHSALPSRQTALRFHVNFKAGGGSPPLMLQEKLFLSLALPSKALVTILFMLQLSLASSPPCRRTL
jgi:hypothetical protein